MHKVYHISTAFLLSTLSISRYKVEAIIFIVLNSCKPKVDCLLLQELITHSLVWKLNHLVLGVCRA